MISGELGTDLDLDALRLAFEASRSRVEASAILREPVPDRCRYCGARWRKWAGSRLDGHARCFVDDDFIRIARAALRGPIGLSVVADLLGVSLSVIRAWLRSN